MSFLLCSYSLIAFLSRGAVENATSFSDAKAMLSETKLIADVYVIALVPVSVCIDNCRRYYIIADAAVNGAGCVLARNQSGLVNDTCIAAPAKWFVVQTNYDCTSRERRFKENAFHYRTNFFPSHTLQGWAPVPWYDNRMVPATDMLRQLGPTNLSFANLFGLLSTKPVLNQMTAFSALAVPGTGMFSVLQRWCNDPCPF